jgi:hypothetical protein
MPQSPHRKGSRTLRHVRSGELPSIRLPFSVSAVCAFHSNLILVFIQSSIMCNTKLDAL